MRRRLFYYKILAESSIGGKQRCNRDEARVSSGNPIPVRISNRQSNPLSPPQEVRGSWLRPIRFESTPRLPKVRLPTFLFSNVRSLFNKTDAVSILLHQHQVDVGLFVETWLKEELPDARLPLMVII